MFLQRSGRFNQFSRFSLCNDIIGIASKKHNAACLQAILLPLNFEARKPVLVGMNHDLSNNYLNHQEGSSSIFRNFHYSSRVLNQSSSQGEDQIILTEQEKPIYELFMIVQKSVPLAYRIYDNVNAFTTLLAQIDTLIVMLKDLSKKQDTFLGDPITEIIEAAKELNLSILCRRASSAMVLWRKAETPKEKEQYSEIMERDYAKALESGSESDEVNFAYATYLKIVKSDLRMALHHLTKSIDLNNAVPVKFLKRAELNLELFDEMKDNETAMNIEQERPEPSDMSTSERSNNSQPLDNTLSVKINSEWSDDALEILNNCLMDCERYIEDSIQYAKKNNMTNFILDYYVYYVRGRVFSETFKSEMNQISSNSVFLNNAERDFTLFVEHFEKPENESLIARDILAEGYVRRALCRMHSKNLNGADADVERANALLDSTPDRDMHSDMRNYIEELKLQIQTLQQFQSVYDQATELGAKAAECQSTGDSTQALEYLNEAIAISEDTPIPTLYVQRSMVYYDMFLKRCKEGIPHNDPISTQYIEKVAHDCNRAIEIDPSSKTTEARVVLAEYYKNVTGEKDKAVEQYEIVLKNYLQENDQEMIKTIEQALDDIKKLNK
ncbi:hypothetical protein C9374_012320 [Naegleria lovaniensis]|uniref:Uncharacterized protein n=1 Tax=Naegleria lovaniensis TaxID=51637 RepID=A0AA88G7V0_NAELO|nr:uncharacterized protein C9374_012320 [Naegleria lovaniensis]KAG2373217.1 hypothetical protein C9374_012320 [Naegleria lovaniensis]